MWCKRCGALMVRGRMGRWPHKRLVRLCTACGRAVCLDWNTGRLVILWPGKLVA